jgi:hypothetical protein
MVPMRNPRRIRFHAAAGLLLFAVSAGAQIVVTGDSRTVTEPAFPAVCQQVTAAITEVNNDIATLYVANQGVTMKLRFGGKAVPT